MTQDPEIEGNGADAIVRNLADEENEPITQTDLGMVCAICDTFLPDHDSADATDHAPDCPWRQAVEETAAFPNGRGPRAADLIVDGWQIVKLTETGNSKDIHEYNRAQIIPREYRIEDRWRPVDPEGTP